MSSFAVWAICLLQIISLVNGDGKYSIIGPGTLHSGKKYNVAVSVYQLNEPAQFKVGIVGPEYNETKTIDLQTNEVKNVEFDVPAIKEGEYNLTAEGVTGLLFRNTTKLNYQDFTSHVKIQTDKGKYKPGDKLNFRVVFLDENLRPTKPREDLVIFIEDAKRNRIKEFKHVEVMKGVYTGSFEISEFPVLGSWSIHVENGREFPSQAYFDVSKYVLPKFQANVEATDHVAVQDGDMQVVVRANYTFNKPFNGKVTLVLELNSYYEHINKTPPVIIKRADMVNGKAKFDLNVNEYEEYMTKKRGTYYLSITATVEEDFTGVQLNSTASSYLYPYRYQMSCVQYGSCSTFYTDKETEVPIKLSRVDKIEFKDTKSVVKMIYTEKIHKVYVYQDSSETTEEPPAPEIENKVVTFEGHMNESNIVVFKVKLPALAELKGYDHYYSMTGVYATEDHELYNTYQYVEPEVVPPPAIEEPKDYFRANTQYEDRKYRVQIGESVNVTLNSSVPLSYFVFNVIGRGNVLHSERVNLPTPTKVYNITIIPTFSHAPSSKLYIHYVDEIGEFHYTETSLNVEVKLQNSITISAPEQVTPGEDVALKIKTPANSFVGLLAVDQSVLLLGSNNDFSEGDFRWRLGSYRTSAPWAGGYSYQPGTISGVVTMTNADYFYNWTKPEYGGPHGQSMYASADSAGGFGLKKKTMVKGPGGPVTSIAEASPRVRKNFEEIWIFANIENTPTEEFVWKKQIPDTITSWILSAFSLHPENGLGVTKEKSTVVTFQPFFITVRLPYSVKRGEAFNVPTLVFNYLDKDLDVDVTLENTDGEYEFIEVSNEVINEEKRTKTVRVASQSSAGVSFMIRPKIIGNIMLKLTATSPIAGDAIHKTLKAVPEGVTEYFNRAYFVNLKDSADFVDTFELAIPADVVPDSEHIEFNVVGDLLGPVVNNLDRLVRMPGGCGEQVTSAMMANFVVLQYLKTTHKLTDRLESKIKRNIEAGYQRILGYRNIDGSFNAFNYWYWRNNQPRSGSTWLTAYIVDSLTQLHDVIKIDEKVIHDGMLFLRGRQAENGTFVENGDVFYTAQSQHIALTASVLLALKDNVHNKFLSEMYKDNIDKGLKYISENWESTENLNAQALAAYLLHVTKHPKSAEFVGKLKGQAKTESDRKWWSKHEQSSRWWWHVVRSSDVEATSYMLLTLLDTETVDDVFPIVRWLVAQRNSYGGFGSTQDTFVGLRALTKFVEKSGYEPALMEIDYQAKGGKNKQATVKVNEDNGLVFQVEELPQSTKAIEFHAKGKGGALVQVAYQYNVLEKEPTPSFSITTVVNKDTPKLKLNMDICVEYVGEGAASNMAVLEVTLPSGFTTDEDSLEHLTEISRVQLTETKHSNTVVIVYFDSLRKSDLVCVPIEAFKTHPVGLQKPAPVVVYDYYDTTRKATNFYVVSSKLCDICDNDEECIKACA